MIINVHEYHSFPSKSVIRFTLAKMSVYGVYPSKFLKKEWDIFVIALDLKLHGNTSDSRYNFFITFKRYFLEQKSAY